MVLVKKLQHISDVMIVIILCLVARVIETIFGLLDAVFFLKLNH